MWNYTKTECQLSVRRQRKENQSQAMTNQTHFPDFIHTSSLLVLLVVYCLCNFHYHTPSLGEIKLPTVSLELFVQPAASELQCAHA